MPLSEGNIAFDRPIDSDSLKHIIEGLYYLHNYERKNPPVHGIIHRDIKPSNILVILRKGQNPLLKLADFGISKKLEVGERDVTDKRRGSTGWMAPELFETTAEYTKAVDIFAAGLVLFYATANGNHPFAPEDSADVGSKLQFDVCQENIKKFKITKLNLIEDSHPEMHYLVQWMMKRKHDDRPSIAQILYSPPLSFGHPYFWTVEMKLDYIHKTSNMLDRLDPDPVYHVLEKDLVKKSVFTSDPSNPAIGWDSKLTHEVKQDLFGSKKKNVQNYNVNSVCHLIRAIRNKVGPHI